jgi:hypothetical protein
MKSLNEELDHGGAQVHSYLQAYSSLIWRDIPAS